MLSQVNVMLGNAFGMKLVELPVLARVVGGGGGRGGGVARYVLVSVLGLPVVDRGRDQALMGLLLAVLAYIFLQVRLLTLTLTHMPRPQHHHNTAPSTVFL